MGGGGWAGSGRGGERRVGGVREGGGGLRGGGGVEGGRRHHIDEKFVFLQLLPLSESSIKVTGGWIWISPTPGTCPPSVPRRVAPFFQRWSHGPETSHSGLVCSQLMIAAHQ